MSEVNKYQVGGDHYRSEYQHWDFIEDNGLGYLEAAATKYVMRWRKKEGLRDLQKAVHYTEKLIDKHKTRSRLPRGIAPQSSLDRLFNANPDLTGEEQLFVVHLSRWERESDLRKAIDIVRKMIQAEEARLAASGVIPQLDQTNGL